MAQFSHDGKVDLAHKPMMTTPQILLMNVGFFGIQYSFGMQQNVMSPIYQFLGASPDELPILNLAGPVTGLLIQPLIGALSDRTWSDKWGRRKPFFLVGAVGCSLFLFLMPFVTAVWMAVLCLWLLDASNNTAMEPYRAFIGDRLPSKQIAKGFLSQSLFIGAGSALAAGTLDYLEEAKFSGVSRVRASAKLAGEGLLALAGRDDTHDISILFAKERYRARGPGLLYAHHPRHHGLGSKDLCVDHILDTSKLVGGHGLEVREVEAQAIWCHERASLAHVIAEDLLERCIQKVRGRMVPADELTSIVVHDRIDRITHPQLTRHHIGYVCHKLTLMMLRISHDKLCGLADEPAGIAYLATHLAIEARPIEDDLNPLTRRRMSDLSAVRIHHGEHLGAAADIRVVALEERLGKPV